MKKTKAVGGLVIAVLAAQIMISCGPHKLGLADIGNGDSLKRAHANQGSIYSINVTLQNQDARTIPWQSLSGKVQVMAMIFTHCQASCPMITNEIKDAEALIPESMRDRVGFTLISFDSKRDTAARLKEHYTAMHLDSLWQLLHGNPADIQTIANLLDVKFKEVAEGNFSHSNVIVVVDEKGHIILREEGIEKHSAEIARTAQFLL
ncbi:MAG: SCO family protein [Bacteroidota bacterium]|nr:SCO family protein [Bacteroidota bacterium]MDP4232437.1 SCO family protein [Bacteroidota bacterium]MDP4241573.1 SCO family protein [Bacteroidota bacterium]MDP4286317.1 SCO family protein [Bacteroidota bacterium]